MEKNKPFELILFDLEGTLVDFQWRLADAVKEILLILTDAGIDPDQYGASPSYASLYNTTWDITSRWDPDKAACLFDQMTTVYDRFDKDALSRWTPYPDTQKVLETLDRSGYRMGVVSNCGTYAATRVIEKFNLDGFFELTLARNDVSRIKPSPEGLILALEKLNMLPEKSLFVGDSLNDILAAKSVPMPSCFLLGGESLVTGEKGQIATFQVSSLSDLPDILI